MTRAVGAPRRSSRAGFSMIEVLAGMGFLSISFLGLTSLSLMTIKATSEARHISAATNLARTKIEELRIAGYAAASSGADPELLSEVGEAEGPGAIYERWWAVESGPTATTKQVTVSVRWSETPPRLISLNTAIAK
jgi:Tfp pilus assembly protein PilV